MPALKVSQAVSKASEWYSVSLYDTRNRFFAGVQSAVYTVDSSIYKMLIGD